MMQISIVKNYRRMLVYLLNIYCVKSVIEYKIISKRITNFNESHQTGRISLSISYLTYFANVHCD